jgi:hypothetical protein
MGEEKGGMIHGMKSGGRFKGKFGRRHDFTGLSDLMPSASEGEILSRSKGKTRDTHARRQLAHSSAAIFLASPVACRTALTAQGVKALSTSRD